MKYIKQLDSLRAIAVIAVIITHWLPAGNILQRITNRSLGGIGVDMFFVLSGFLITRILFDSRNKAAIAGHSKSTLVKNFYIRRALRIFPIYYLVIFLLLIFHYYTDSSIQYSFGYFAAYISNFYFYNRQSWDGLLSHLWSLSVEEQFYLIWPWIALFANKKYLLRLICGFILVGIVCQYLTLNLTMGDILTFNCFDAFGIGALLAWQMVYKADGLLKFNKWLSIVSTFAAALFILGFLQHGWFYVPLRLLVSVISAWLIAYIILNEEAGKLRFKFIFNNRILIFIGKISYGIYLYHNIIPTMLNVKLVNIYFNPYLPNMLFKHYWGQLFLAENAILLVLVSWLSYQFIERPFLSLKRYFEYGGQKAGI